uniref:Uncharacterized protein n=1 Tax=Aplanochytrium stocchinoi TaxID=215587 RepID=A0A7S3LH19_9STRA
MRMCTSGKVFNREEGEGEGIFVPVTGLSRFPFIYTYPHDCRSTLRSHLPNLVSLLFEHEKSLDMLQELFHTENALNTTYMCSRIDSSITLVIVYSENGRKSKKSFHSAVSQVSPDLQKLITSLRGFEKRTK